VAVFGLSFVLLLALPNRRGPRHPANGFALASIGILILSIFHPTTNSLLSGVAQTALYAAVFAPLFWVPRLKVDPDVLVRVLMFMLLFHTLSSFFGVLQVRFPGHFQPPLTSVLSGRRSDYLKSLMIQTSSGDLVYRPMGLTDMPGGASIAGLHAILLGMGFLLVGKRKWLRLVSVTGIVLGLSALAMSQVRSVLLIALLDLVVFVGLLAWRNLRIQSARQAMLRRSRVRILPLIFTVVLFATLGVTLALSLAGKSVSDRFGTLLKHDASTVYYSNRGHFLDDTINVFLPEYPLGAGLGRWGMVHYYFGDSSNLESPPLYVEIQWTGWLFDGGVPLIVTCLIAIGLAMSFSLKTALRAPTRELAVCAALIFAFNLGLLADTFDYVPFIGETGVEFWLLNAMLFAAVKATKASEDGRRTVAR
jgi:hypothetical protein